MQSLLIEGILPRVESEPPKKLAVMRFAAVLPSRRDPDLNRELLGSACSSNSSARGSSRKMSGILSSKIMMGSAAPLKEL